jgi:ectoine hydroxylase-related dioxygenase (phytanoyl-CoA dioxygenase family)
MKCRKQGRSKEYMLYKKIKEQILSEGFAIADDIFTQQEIDLLLSVISKADANKVTFRKTNDLFAIRQFLKEIPDAVNIIFNDRLRFIISKIFSNGFFAVKSIYFDKPEQSNWFVSYHQDLTISVENKYETEGFTSWTIKQNQFAVQPPLNILQNNFTIRIHLDDTDEQNGALRIIPKSHLKGIVRQDKAEENTEPEMICSVKKGGIMIMKPLLLHASNRTTNNKKRRVVHIEFSNQKLPGKLNWSEFIHLKNKTLKPRA